MARDRERIGIRSVGEDHKTPGYNHLLPNGLRPRHHREKEAGEQRAGPGRSHDGGTTAARQGVVLAAAAWRRTSAARR